MLLYSLFLQCDVDSRLSLKKLKGLTDLEVIELMMKEVKHSSVRRRLCIINMSEEYSSGCASLTCQKSHKVKVAAAYNRSSVERK